MSKKKGVSKKRLTKKEKEFLDSNLLTMLNGRSDMRRAMKRFKKL